ncbi:MAG TPA: ABC transporter substrate-binding protein [Solirubrobacteraceae bacterium]|jgi:NitT/TauT family transport system substrate-binding protein/putative hydroxymethylpyrimidine transport system substrate-binding protein
MLSPAAIALALLALLSLAGCGGSSRSSREASTGAGKLARMTKATLVLDFVPNAVHAGIYRALGAGYYRRANIDLKVIQPSATAETLALIDSGRADFGLADGSDVAAQIARGGDGEAVMAIAQRPLGGLIGLASSGLRSPAQLQGRTVGVTGVPSDVAVLDTEVRHAGGDPGKVRVVTSGFDGAQGLLAGKLAAFTGFVPDDGVRLQAAGHPIVAFRLDENGGPAYPGLVAFTTRRLIAADPALVASFVAATVHGYEDTIAEPVRSLRELLSMNPSLAPGLTHASLDAYLPLFAGGRVPFGTLQPHNLAALSEWMVENHLIRSPVSPARYGTNRFVPRAGS